MGKVSEINEVFLESFKLCKKNKASFITPIITLIFSFIPYFIAIWVHIVFFQSPASAIALSILVLIIATYIRSFFSSMQTWIIAHTVWEEKVSFSEGFKRTIKHSGNVLFFSIITLIVSLTSQSRKIHKKNFLAGIIRKYFEGIPEDMWETVANICLPGMVIGQKNFADSMNEVKKGTSYVSEISFNKLKLQYFTYPIIILGIMVAVFVSWRENIIVELGILFFVAFLIVIYLVQNHVKTSYYTVLYIWMGEQIQRKKKKKSFESRVPAILENNVKVEID